MRLMATPTRSRDSGWIRVLERCCLAGFFVTSLWILAGWMRPTPVQSSSMPPRQSGAEAGGRAAASGLGVPATPPAIRASPPSPARLGAGAAPDPPLTFAVDPFADGTPTVTVVVPEPPTPQRPVDPEDARPDQGESQ
jgi:hypothetical protein